VVLDPKHELLAEFDYTKTAQELAAQFRGATSVVDRVLVMQRLGNKDAGAEKVATITAALSDPFHNVRGMALQSIETPTAEQQRLTTEMAKSDPHSEVRALAISLLAEWESPELNAVAREALNARPYAVVAAGLQALVLSDPAAAAEAATDLENIDNTQISVALADIYAAAGDPAKLSFFEKQMGEIDGFAAIELFENYRSLLAKGTEAQLLGGISKMSAMGTDMTQSPWRRIAATKTLNDMREEAKAEGAPEMVDNLGKIITEIKAKETMDDLKQIYQQYGN
jgi:aminopeptidase N